MNRETAKILLRIREDLDRQEADRFSVFAVPGRSAIRRRPESRESYRQPFAQDADRILHSRAYTRYIDKTQVFSLVDNDHITHRVLHVQMVSRIARTVARFLGLNEDLVEAIALGHDIGHPPFGHEGENILSKLCRDNGLPSFQHNIQSIQFLDRFERKGMGWNLTLQVLDGILCHDGEVHNPRLVSDRGKDFDAFDREAELKARVPGTSLVPMTLEGCVVRLSDTIAYIGRDIEDAIELGLIDRNEIPAECGERLGISNGTIVHTLVTDLVGHSQHVRRVGQEYDAQFDYVGFSPEVAEAMFDLKKFNYDRIYRNPAFKPDFDKIHRCYEELFGHYLRQLEGAGSGSEAGRDFLQSMPGEYLASHPPAAVVRDYIAGMTDDFFLRQARSIGCDIPERTCLPG
jgi:dGTPase